MAKFDPSDLTDDLVDQIDEKIAEIEKRLAKVQPLIDEKTKLIAARRALIGGTNRLTGGTSGTRLRQEDVVSAMTLRTGYSVEALAQTLNASPEQVRGHLNRGKGERFINYQREWYLRDPEEGLDTPADIANLEDEDE